MLGLREIRVDGQRYFVLSEYRKRLLVQADTGKLRMVLIEGPDFRFIDPEPGTDPTISHAPWTAEEVESLVGYQACGVCHPFTGENDDLIPTAMGWTETVGGPVSQTWAHKSMVDGSWRNHPFLTGKFGSKVV